MVRKKFAACIVFVIVGEWALDRERENGEKREEGNETASERARVHKGGSTWYTSSFM